MLNLSSMFALYAATLDSTEIETDKSMRRSYHYRIVATDKTDLQKRTYTVCWATTRKDARKQKKLNLYRYPITWTLYIEQLVFDNGRPYKRQIIR